MPNSNFEPAQVDDYASGSDAWDNTFVPEESMAREEAAREESRSFAAAPEVLAANGEWFATAVADCDSIDNIQIKEMLVNGVTYSRKVSIEAQVLAYQLLKIKLSEKAAEYQRFMEEA